MIKGYGMRVSDDMRMLLDNWMYLDKGVINMEIFYYNVPIDEADIQDDMGHIQGISVGDLLRLQPLFKQILGFRNDNKLIFYALKPVFNEYHQGLIFATDFSFNPYVFIVDNVELAYSMLYQKMGIAKLEYQKGYPALISPINSVKRFDKTNCNSTKISDSAEFNLNNFSVFIL